VSFNIENFQQAQYKDFVFPFKEEKTIVGQSYVIHEFSNQDYDGIQSTGLIPDRYEWLVTLSGEDFLSKRKKLISLLKDNTPGLLIHPLDGKITDVYLMPAELPTSISAVGYMEVMLTFRVGRNTVAPTAITNKKIAIDNAYDESFNAISADLQNMPVSFPSSEVSLYSSITENINTVVDSISLLTTEPIKLSRLISGFSNIRSNFFNLIKTPETLAALYSDLLKDGFELTEYKSEVVFAGMNSFQSIPAKQEYFRQTVQEKEKIDNANAVNSATRQAEALKVLKAYSEIEFTSAEEVVSAIKGVSLLEKNMYFTDDSSNRKYMLNMVSLVQNFLSDEKIKARQTIAQSVYNTPASVVSFQYYGDSSKTEQIMESNKNINISYYNGDVKLLV
jgi:prophage DNA circulation protein